MQCPVVAIRPLRVEELAEILAVDFDDASGIPKLKPSWRWEDHEQAVLTSCSSLIVIVDTDLSRIVQFSHFSVKEFLTSERLATSSQVVSHYHIILEPAHTIMAQACLSTLLRLDNLIEDSGVEECFPLARYAAEHWVGHTQFEDVASRVKGMEDLFDPDKPYFAAWCKLHDIDTRPPYRSTFFQFSEDSKSGANTPLYYAALCGFPNLVEQLISKHPEQVNAIGGHCKTPAVAALAGRHFQLAQLLHRRGSSIDPPGRFGISTLHSAVCSEDLEMVQVLLDYGVDINAHNDVGCTPLNFGFNGCFNDPKVVQLLLDHDADPNVPMKGGITPLHHASRYGTIEVARLLAEHGASIEAKDEEGKTPLDYASGERCDEKIKLLSEYCTK
jgi:hypothetical protein